MGLGSKIKRKLSLVRDAFLLYCVYAIPFFLIEILNFFLSANMVRDNLLLFLIMIIIMLGNLCFVVYISEKPLLRLFNSYIARRILRYGVIVLLLLEFIRYFIFGFMQLSRLPDVNFYRALREAFWLYADFIMILILYKDYKFGLKPKNVGTN